MLPPLRCFAREAVGTLEARGKGILLLRADRLNDAVRYVKVLLQLAHRSGAVCQLLLRVFESGPKTFRRRLGGLQLSVAFMELLPVVKPCFRGGALQASVVVLQVCILAPEAFITGLQADILSMQLCILALESANLASHVLERCSRVERTRLRRADGIGACTPDD